MKGMSHGGEEVVMHRGWQQSCRPEAMRHPVHIAEPLCNPGVGCAQHAIKVI